MGRPWEIETEYCYKWYTHFWFICHIVFVLYRAVLLYAFGISRSNTIRYCKQFYRDIRFWTHKRHTLPSSDGRAMVWMPWEITTIYQKWNVYVHHGMSVQWIALLQATASHRGRQWSYTIDSKLDYHLDPWEKSVEADLIYHVAVLHSQAVLLNSYWVGNISHCPLEIWIESLIDDYQDNLVAHGCGMSHEIARRWMSVKLKGEKSTLVQVMAWCRQVTNYYPSQCGARSVSPCVVNVPQWLNITFNIIYSKQLTQTAELLSTIMVNITIFVRARHWFLISTIAQ